MTIASGYTIMQMLVMFDLPVGTAGERKSATKFRNDLMNLGFLMHQFSVYIKRCPSKEKVDSVVRKIHHFLPKDGNVHIIWITDKQLCDSIHLWNGSELQKPKDKDENLLIF
ncbi:MAG: CRISPR-associated endonuclease Cas2 [Pseudomonadota bacterium]|jgi:CRISPR-associated protein Cas2